MRLFRRPALGLSLSLLILLIFLELLPTYHSITITTVYAGKKKFRSYNLGLSFLPTLVKVKPNRFALSFRRSRYIRPPKFDISGSLPLKVPTIIMERPDPYAKPEIININKDIKLGQDEDYGGGGGSYYKGNYKAASEERPTSTTASEDNNPDLYSAASEGLPVPTDDRVPPEDQWAAPPPPQSAFYPPPPPPPPHFIPPPPPFSPMFPPPSSSEGAALPYPPPPPPPFHLMPPSLIDPMFMARRQQQQPEQSEQHQQKHRTRRSLNLNEPYHHHIGDHTQQQQQQFRVRRMPHEYAPSSSPSSSSAYPIPPPPPPPPLPFGYPRYPPSAMYNYHPYYYPQASYHHQSAVPPPFGATFLPPPPPPPPPPPMWSSPAHPGMYSSYHHPHNQQARASTTIAKQDTIAPEAQQFVVHEVPMEASSNNGAPVILKQQPNNFEIPVDYSIQKEVVNQQQQQQPQPMKINIGEHYNPNAVYMDESIIPSMEDAPLITETMAAEGAPLEGAESSMGEESSYQSQYQKPYSSGGGYKDNGGPDDFRVNFSFSGVHGGPLVPLGTGDNIEQYYKALKKFKGNNLPVGLPPEQLYRYYRAHTFTDGIRVYRLGPTKIVKSKLLKAILG